MRTGWFGFKKMDIEDFSTVYSHNGESYAFDNFFSRPTIGEGKIKLIMDKSIFDNYPGKKYNTTSKGLSINTIDNKEIYLSSMHGQGNNKKIMGLIYAQIMAQKMLSVTNKI